MANEHKWYSLKRILGYDVKYRVIVGERSNGKTYAIKQRVIQKYFENKEQFMYIRRTHDEITRGLMKELFDDINPWCMEQYSCTIEYMAGKGFYLINDEGEEVGIIGYCTSLQDGLRAKGVPYPQITTIWFDEFLSYEFKIDREESKFLNIVSTIVRKRKNVEVFMLGNTITRYSLYFKLLGIDITKVKQGHIYYVKHKMGATVAFEYTTSMNVVNGQKAIDEYLGFDNSPVSSMILYGEWEYQICNTQQLDGIGWSSKRMLIPMYVTALGECYEMSLYLNGIPIAFVRKINTQQNGFVKRGIKYNLSYDNSLQLVSKDGIVATFGKVNSLIDKKTLEMYEIFTKCIEAKRVVYENMATGSDFSTIIKNL